MRTVFALLFCSVLLAGCGQKGPLTLPQDETSAPEQNQ